MALWQQLVLVMCAVVAGVLLGFTIGTLAKQDRQRQQDRMNAHDDKEMK